MKIETAHQAWAEFIASHPEHALRVRSAGAGDDLSLFAEYLAGAYLLSDGHSLLKAEFFRDRVLSPRRRDRAKTCDFETAAAPGQASLFVEVKHTSEDLSTGSDFSSFLKSAYLKGARCLVVVSFPENARGLSQIAIEEIEGAGWSAWLSSKQILKFRRNGLVRLVVLTIS
ncbi:MAG: hypothetical protein ACPGN3_00020 [Opitutales bacterium]